MIFHLRIQTNQAENDEQHILVMQFQIAGQFIGRVGKEGLETLEKGVHVALTDLTYETLDLESGIHHVDRGIIGQQVFDKPLFYLSVREAQRIESKFRIVGLNCQITALIDHRNGIVRGGVDAVQDACAGLRVRHIIKVIFRPFQQLHQIGRCTRLEPIVAEFPFGEGIQQTERVVNTDRVFHEVVTVVTLLQFLRCRLYGQSLVCRQVLNILHQLPLDLRLGNPADRHVTLIHRNVLQIIEIAKDAHLPELRHTRQQGETDATVHRLQHPIEGFQDRAHLALKILIMKCL